MGRKEVCKLLWLQAGHKQFVGGTCKYGINISNLCLNVASILCCKSSVIWVQQVLFSSNQTSMPYVERIFFI